LSEHASSWTPNTADRVDSSSASSCASGITVGGGACDGGGESKGGGGGARGGGGGSEGGGGGGLGSDHAKAPQNQKTWASMVSGGGGGHGGRPRGALSSSATRLQNTSTHAPSSAGSGHTFIWASHNSGGGGGHSGGPRSSSATRLHNTFTQATGTQSTTGDKSKGKKKDGQKATSNPFAALGSLASSSEADSVSEDDERGAINESRSECGSPSSSGGGESKSKAASTTTINSSVPLPAHKPHAKALQNKQKKPEQKQQQKQGQKQEQEQKQRQEQKKKRKKKKKQMDRKKQKPEHSNDIITQDALKSIIESRIECRSHSSMGGGESKSKVATTTPQSEEGILLNDNEAQVLEAVKIHGGALRFASARCKKMKNVVMAAVESFGPALYHASDLLKNDEEVVREAVKQDRRAFEYASQDIKNEPDDEDIKAAMCVAQTKERKIFLSGKMERQNFDLARAHLDFAHMLREDNTGMNTCIQLHLDFAIGICRAQLRLEVKKDDLATEFRALLHETIMGSVFNLVNLVRQKPKVKFWNMMKDINGFIEEEASNARPQSSSSSHLLMSAYRAIEFFETWTLQERDGKTMVVKRDAPTLEGLKAIEMVEKKVEDLYYAYNPPTKRCLKDWLIVRNTRWRFSMKRKLREGSSNENNAWFEKAQTAFKNIYDMRFEAFGPRFSHTIQSALKCADLLQKRERICGERMDEDLFKDVMTYYLKAKRAQEANVRTGSRPLEYQNYLQDNIISPMNSCIKEAKIQFGDEVVYGAIKSIKDGLAPEPSVIEDGEKKLIKVRSLAYRINDTKYELGPNVWIGSIGSAAGGNDECAIKKMPNNSKSKMEVERLLNLKNHDHLVQYIMREETDDFIYVAMEYCNKGTLETYVNTIQNDWSARKEVCRELCKGLSTLHKLRYVHRDLKPQNILFKEERRKTNKSSPNGEGKITLKIADFGISREIALQRTHAKASNKGGYGTTNWQPPEALSADQGDAPDYRKSYDVHPCGSLLFYILSSGQHAFRKNGSDTDHTINDNILKGCSNATKTYWDEKFKKKSGIHRMDLAESRDLIRWMLETDPKRRPSMEEVLEHPFFMSAKEKMHAARKLKEWSLKDWKKTTGVDGYWKGNYYLCWYEDPLMKGVVTFLESHPNFVAIPYFNGLVYAIRNVLAHFSDPTRNQNDVRVAEMIFGALALEGRDIRNIDDFYIMMVDLVGKAFPKTFIDIHHILRDLPANSQADDGVAVADPGIDPGMSKNNK
jgi:serine/threonine protein kinase